MRSAQLALTLGFLGLGLAAQAGTGPTIPKNVDANPTVLKLVIQDQWDRGSDMFGSRKPAGMAPMADMAKRDLEREAAVRALLAQGELRSGPDYYFAALIMQHSPDADGILLAHVLSVKAVAAGDQDGLWMAAATLDRYLIDLKQPQVFGTQFSQPLGKSATMEPYNRSALSDQVRALLHVPTLSEQAAQLASMNARHH
ncbi:MAG TPA: hypothetical protein VN709_09225 [Terriglobales bacterium]|nr:hypothetical protein [Terriglobales bacterium]